MVPTIKIYAIDYSFLIKNYLDKNLWKKTWTLFQYKDYIFTLNLDTINCMDDCILFKIKCNKSCYCRWVYYYINSDMTIDMLKKKIDTAMWELIKCAEEKLIKDLPIYHQLDNMINTEMTYYYNACDVNDELGEDYENWYRGFYRDKNTGELSDLTYTFVEACWGLYATDVYIEFAKATKNQNRLSEIKTAIEHQASKDVLTKINDYVRHMTECDDLLAMWKEVYTDE